MPVTEWRTVPGFTPTPGAVQVMPGRVVNGATPGGGGTSSALLTRKRIWPAPVPDPAPAVWWVQEGSVAPEEAQHGELVYDELTQTIYRVRSVT